MVVYQIGAFIVLDAVNLEIIREDRKSKQYITDIKFSPDGSKVAFASGDGRVYLHEANNHWPFIVTIETTAKNCAISRIDFNRESNLIRMQTTSKELFYYNVDQHCLITSPMTVRDVRFHAPSVAYSWVTQGNCLCFDVVVFVLIVGLLCRCVWSRIYSGSTGDSDQCLVYSDSCELFQWYDQTLQISLSD